MGKRNKVMREGLSDWFWDMSERASQTRFNGMADGTPVPLYEHLPSSSEVDAFLDGVSYAFDAARLALSTRVLRGDTGPALEAIIDSWFEAYLQRNGIHARSHAKTMEVCDGPKG